MNQDKTTNIRALNKASTWAYKGHTKGILGHTKYHYYKPKQLTRHKPKSNYQERLKNNDFSKITEMKII